MNTHSDQGCTAFSGKMQIASGSLSDVTSAVKALLETDATAQVLIFDDGTGNPIDLDLRRTAPLPIPPAATDSAEEIRRPGRPKLGVVAREITLLPRHWEWLASQPGGASVALRKLVEHAIKENANRDRIRRAQEATYRFVSAMAGNEPHFEDAIRALFAGKPEPFYEALLDWPPDIRRYAETLAAPAFATDTTEGTPR